MRELMNIMIPDTRDILYASLAFAIPFTITKIIEKVLDAGKPNWKREEVQQRRED
ncbi:hypothetical protein [Bacillus sp. AK128]